MDYITGWGTWSLLAMPEVRRRESLKRWMIQVAEEGSLHSLEWCMACDGTHADDGEAAVEGDSVDKS